MIVCLDLEGVLYPEMWHAFAAATGNDRFTLTTRDIADYSELMDIRISALNQGGWSLPDVLAVTEKLHPLEGAVEFLQALRNRQIQIVILSDTFYEFTRVLSAQLGYPTLFCHRLVVDDDAKIIGVKLRQKSAKKASVEALQSLNYPVTAVGDSYNDLEMLNIANRGFLFRAPETIRLANPQFSAFDDYETLLSYILSEK